MQQHTSSLLGGRHALVLVLVKAITKTSKENSTREDKKNISIIFPHQCMSFYFILFLMEWKAI